ncbi:MAG TPA: carbon-nitrogen hydrolase family protein [Aggregatilineaceae bacterium]|nr:carbon-nitrogen hydrolase family protein [Aggregatilineaceae bacterium]
MKQKLKVAAIQMDCAPVPVTERLRRLSPLIAEAAQADAQLVVLPELFNTGYEFHARNYALAETLDGATITWMKMQAAQHAIHLAGTLLLLDKTDIYNTAALVAPDGRLWRYDKYYVPLWERAYFRGGHQTLVADTDLGRLGMMICWDQMHPDLWAHYAGQVDAIVIMSCPGDWDTAALVFPDGFRAKFMDLVNPSPVDSEAVEPASHPADVDTQDMHPQAAWMGVPLIAAAATGTIRTKLPLLEWFLERSPYADRTSQAAETLFECGFAPETKVFNAGGQLLAQGTETDDGVVLAEIELPDVIPQPSTPQPSIDIPQAVYQVSDEIIPSLMLPLYKAGVRRQWGAHMAPD